MRDLWNINPVCGTLQRLIMGVAINGMGFRRPSTWTPLAGLVVLLWPWSVSALEPDQVTGASYGRDGDTGAYALAWDGNTSTYGSPYTGVDLGEPKRISRIMIWTGDNSQDLYQSWLHGSNTGPHTDLVVLQQISPPAGRPHEWFTAIVSDPTPYRWINFTSYFSRPVAEIKVFGPDTQPPAVISSKPLPNAAGVRQIPVTLTFDGPVDRASVEAAFSIAPPVPGSFAWERDPMTSSDKLIFYPLGFAPYTAYTVNISAGAKDVWGNALLRPYALEFETGDLVPPNIISMSPAPYSRRSARPDRITVRFSRPIDVNYVDYSSFFVIRSGGDGLFGGKTGGDVLYYPRSVALTAPDEATLSLEGQSLPDDVYQVRVRGGIQDLEGNRVDGDYLGTFPTGNGYPGGDLIATFVFGPDGDSGNGNQVVRFQAALTAAATVYAAPSTAAASVGSLTKDAIVDIFEETPGWYRTHYVGADAWIPTSAAARLPLPAFRARVIVDSLNVRIGPSTAYAILGTLPRDTVVPVYESVGGWYHIPFNGRQAWISGQYTAVIPNQAPVAENQVVRLPVKGSRLIYLRASDADGDLLSYTVLGAPAHGTLTGAPPSITYTPAPGYTGADSLTFKASDGRSESGVGTIAIDIFDPVLRVTAVNPVSGSIVASPTAVVATFSRALDPITVSPETFRLVRRGLDGVFGTADDTAIAPASVTVVGKNQARLDLSGVTLPPDVYQVRLIGARTKRQEGLGGYWRFDETVGNVAYDSSVRDRANFVFGGTWVPGRIGGALRLGPTGQYVGVDASDFGSPWAAAFWIRSEDSPNASATLLSSSTCAIRLQQYPNLKKVGITKFGSGDYAFNYSLPAGVWTHLTLVGTADATALYVNGVYRETLPVHIDLPLKTFGDPGDGSASATVDELRAYFRALSNAEIRALASVGIADASGGGLDGDFSGAFPSGDGVDGGDFVSTFTVGQPPPSGGGTETKLYDAAVTVSSLNVRSGPGTTYSILGTLFRDQVVPVYESWSGWYRIAPSGTTAKWIYAASSAMVPAPLFSAKVTSSTLNVRTGPGTTYSIVGTLSGGTVVKVYATSGGWYRIIYSGYYRWISGTYVQRL